MCVPLRNAKYLLNVPSTLELPCTEVSSHTYCNFSRPWLTLCFPFKERQYTPCRNMMIHGKSSILQQVLCFPETSHSWRPLPRGEGIERFSRGDARDCESLGVVGEKNYGNREKKDIKRLKNLKKNPPASKYHIP